MKTQGKAILSGITKRKAISYIRFSTLAQGNQGRDSTQRQREALNAALARWNLELDASYSDKGKSGYHQKNIAQGGAMHELRKLAITGKLNGKVLVVEDFDRMGRMQTTDAAPLLLDMLNNGVDLVVGAYGGEFFSRDIVNSNQFAFFNALAEMNRGFGESKRKSDIAKAKWQSRFKAMADGIFVPLNSLPFWLENGNGKFVIKEGLRDLIKRVFALYLAGEGSQVIANKFNKEGIPMPPKKNGIVRKNANVWHSTFIQHLIKNRAVLGYYHNTEHKIFPVLINETDFFRANKKRKERIHFSGRKATHVNPYSGLCYCVRCGGRLSRHSSRINQDTSGKYVYLQCRSSRRGVCSAAGIPYARFEESFAGFIGHEIILSSISLSENVEASKSDEIRNKLINVEKQIAKLKAAFAEIENPEKAVSLGIMLTNYDTQHAQLLKDLENATVQEKGSTPLTKSHIAFLASLFGNQNKLKDPDTRRQIQEALRTAIDRITIDVQKQSYTVALKNSPDVFEVQLTKTGYKISGEGCVNLEMVEF
jgi:DNA invertase Pin-like site-specific DNA recombinase